MKRWWDFWLHVMGLEDSPVGGAVLIILVMYVFYVILWAIAKGTTYGIGY